jgi:hypothetical protein
MEAALDCDDGVEHPVGERQGAGVAADEADRVAVGGDRSGGPQQLPRVDVQPVECDTAAMPVDPSDRAAQAAADVEDRLIVADCRRRTDEIR